MYTVPSSKPIHSVSFGGGRERSGHSRQKVVAESPVQVDIDIPSSPSKKSAPRPYRLSPMSNSKVNNGGWIVLAHMLVLKPT
jgi:hypothetical protein